MAKRTKLDYTGLLATAVARGNWAKFSTAEDWTFRAFMDAVAALVKVEAVHVSRRTLQRATDASATADFDTVKAFVRSHMLRQCT